MSRRRLAPPWALAIVAMSSAQLGSALSVSLIHHAGAAGTTWLRMTVGAAIFVALAPPWQHPIRRRDLPALVGLGVTTGLQTIAFLAAITRIPLGTCVAIELLGPLTVAARQAHRRNALMWPALAALGVLLLTSPWHGKLHLAGLAYAAVAGVGWGIYILLTQRVGDRYDGVRGLAITVPISALTAAVAGVPQAAGALDLSVLAQATGLALLMPVLTYACEMSALRRMTHTAFGTLMALEPAIAIVLGAIVLSQVPSVLQVAGITLVVLAGAGAQRGGLREPGAHTGPPPVAEVIGSAASGGAPGS